MVTVNQSDSDTEQERIERLPPERGRGARGTRASSRVRGRPTSVWAVSRKQDVRTADEQQSFVGKWGKVWSGNPLPTSKRSARNIVRSLPGFATNANKMTTFLSIARKRKLKYGTVLVVQS